MKVYIVSPRLTVVNANCVQSVLVAGFPSQSQFAGHSHAMSRHLLPAGVLEDGIQIIVHDFLLNKGSPKSPADIMNGKPQAGRLIESIRGRIEYTLVQRVDVPNSETYKLLERRIKDHGLQVALRLPALGGSTMSIGDHPSVFSSLESLEKSGVMTKLPWGWIIRERIDLLRDASNKMEAVISALSFSRARPDEENPNDSNADTDADVDGDERGPADTSRKVLRRAQKGLIIPMGHNLSLQEPLSYTRKGTRADTKTSPHAFASPLIGLGEFIRFRGKLEDVGVWWRYRIMDDGVTYAVTTT